MSKTKEEILKPYVVLGDDSPDFAYPSDVYVAMDEYAAQVLKENLIAFKRWYDKLTPSDKCTVWAPPGSGYGRGLYDMSDEDLIDKFLKKKS